MCVCLFMCARVRESERDEMNVCVERRYLVWAIPFLQFNMN